jgi:hypothetical protein
LKKVVPVDSDFSADVLQEALKGFDQRALSRAVGAEDAGEFTFGDVEVYIPDDIAPAVAGPQILDLENAHRTVVLTSFAQKIKETDRPGISC